MELNEAEKRSEEWLKRTPEQYPTDKRVCPNCDQTFPKEAINEHAAHLASHNPSPAQWVEANKRIELGKERSKQTR